MSERALFIVAGVLVFAAAAVYLTRMPPALSSPQAAPAAPAPAPVAAAPVPETPAVHSPPPAVRPAVQPPVQSIPEPAVLRIARAYADGGGFNWDGGTGTPEEIRFKGERILSRSKVGTYCCGFTFAVVMRAAAEAGLLEEKTVSQMRKFQQHWYAATPQAREKQQIFALEWLGIGHEVPLMEALPGDFVRLWHGGSGHSVILVRWIVEHGKKTGIEYRATQGSTDGIGNRTEYLPGTPGHEAGDFNLERTYAGRLNPGRMTK